MTAAADFRNVGVVQRGARICVDAKLLEAGAKLQRSAEEELRDAWTRSRASRGRARCVQGRWSALRVHLRTREGVVPGSVQHGMI
jgi:hypothetical protein